MTKAKLAAAGITKVNQLIFANSTQSEIKTSLTTIFTASSLPLSHLNAFHQQAKTALPGAEPESINYLSADNPYEAHYGENWEEEIKKVRTMSKYSDVHDLVYHIHDAMRDAFKSTKHE